MRAIQVTQFGGPEVLVPTELDPPVAGPDQLLVEVSAAGVNFAGPPSGLGSKTHPNQPVTLPSRNQSTWLRRAGDLRCEFRRRTLNLKP